MSFIWPWALLGMLLVPTIVGLYWWMLRSRDTRDAAILGQGYSDGNEARWKRHLPGAMALLGLCPLLFGVARPLATIDVPQYRSTVVFVFDTSWSMVADDLEPSRLGAAKESARIFVGAQPESVEIGIVSFGSTGATTLRPTDDRSAILASIDRLEAAGGTSLSEGLFAGLSTIAESPILYLPDERGEVDIPPVDFGGFGSAIIVLFSDGEDTSGQPVDSLAELAATNGIRIYTVGLGSLEGAVIEVDGFSVATALDELALQELADVSNGTYFHVDSADDLITVTDSLERDLELNEEHLELTSLFGAGSLVIIAIAAILGMRRTGRMP